MEKAGETNGARVQGAGGGKGSCPRAQLVFGTSKRRPLARMPAQTKFADGSAQFHLALT